LEVGSVKKSWSDGENRGTISRKFQPRARKCVYLCHKGVNGLILFDLIKREFFFIWTCDFLWKRISFYFFICVLQFICSNISLTNAITPSPTSQSLFAENYVFASPNRSIFAVPPPTHRVSTQTKHPPKYLWEYHWNIGHTQQALNQALCISYPLSDYMNFNYLSPTYKSFCLAVSHITKPKTDNQTGNMLVGSKPWIKKFKL